MRRQVLIALLFLVRGAGADEATVTGTHTAWNPLGGAPPPLRTLAEPLTFRQKRPEGAVAAAKETIQPRYATVRLAGKVITFVLAASDEKQKQPDRLFVDLEGDGKLSPVELKLDERALENGSTAYFRTAPSVPVRIAGRSLPVGFQYRGLDDDPYDAQVVPHWYLEATVTIGGETHALFAQDYDRDGAYGSDVDLWFVSPDKTRPKALRPFLLTRFGAGKFLFGHRVVVTGGKNDKLIVRSESAKGPLREDLVSAREFARSFWFALLAKDEAAQGGAPDDRPRTDKRIEWRDLTLKEAKELSRKKNKPVFVDLHSLASGSCFRVCYTTFQDEEVHRLLSTRFISVRAVRQENGEVFSEYVKALAAKKLPSMGVILPNSDAPQLIAGWKDAASMVYTLRTALGEKVERDWTPFFGEFPFVIGYEAGLKEAKFTGRPPMLFAVSFHSVASRKFAQRSFTKKLAGKLLDHYTPILIDIDADPRMAKKFPVLVTTPAIVWLDFDGDEVFMNGGDVPLYLWEELVKIPCERAPERTVPAAYTALLELRDELRAAQAADDPARARKAIAAIERVGQGVRVQAEAAAAKKKLAAR